MYLLDTNICIYIINKRPLNVIRVMEDLPMDAMSISSITVAELEFGVQKSSKIEQNRSALNLFLQPFEIQPFDLPASMVYGEIRCDLERRGEIIGAMDLLISAQAKALKKVLVTNNTRDFERIQGLSLENWVC